jgi:protein CpxP
LKDFASEESNCLIKEKMKKSILMVALFIGFSTLGFAQEQGARPRLSPEERAQKKTELLTEKLSLTKEQQEKVLAINLEEAKSNEEFMKKTREERMKDISERRESMKATDEKIVALLTEDQKKAFQELKAEQRKNLREGVQNRRPARNRKAE